MKYCLLFLVSLNTTNITNFINANNTLPTITNNRSEDISFFQDPIEVKIVLDEDGLYQVILHSNATFENFLSFVSTAQITITAPTGGFIIGEIESHIGNWRLSSVFQKPEEAENTDYFSFSLTGCKDEFSFEEGKEITKFTFKNTGTCTGGVEIMKINDPFYPPNSLSVNIGNVIVFLGNGSRNGFEGVYDEGSANCMEQMLPPLDMDSTAITPAIEIESPANGKIQWTPIETAISYQVKARLKGASLWQTAVKLNTPSFYYYKPKNQINEYQITTFFEDGHTELSTIFEIDKVGNE